VKRAASYGINSMNEDYRVNLDIYNGPMDLLLYLIRRDEVDIYDIPIVGITEQYLKYVDVVNALDPNMSGEFLVMAATLMEIKTRMLLPVPEAGEEGDDEPFDPRSELVRQLLEYKSFKDAAGTLHDAGEQQAMSHPRRPGKLDIANQETDMEDLQVWDLMRAFNKLLNEIGGESQFHEVIYDDTPVELHKTDIMDRLGREGRLTFDQIFEGRADKTEVIGLFMAILHLMSDHKIRVSQDGMYGQIDIDLRPDKPDDEAMEGTEES
jgi:segregation and condensation protein A